MELQVATTASTAQDGVYLLLHKHAQELDNCSVMHNQTNSKKQHNTSVQQKSIRRASNPSTTPVTSRN